MTESFNMPSPGKPRVTVQCTNESPSGKIDMNTVKPEIEHKEQVSPYDGKPMYDFYHNWSSSPSGSGHGRIIGKPFRLAP